MSHIPETAMPHAKPTEDGAAAQTATEAKSGGKAEKVSTKATKTADKVTEAVRANPKTAIGIGAAVVAGIAAAVAAPAVLAKSKDSPGKKSGAKKSGSTKTK
jgi:hypothetical protein